jgi:hypothetical protein
MIVAVAALIAFSLWLVQHVRGSHKAAERERGYQNALTQYLVKMKPGMTREQVERHLHTDGKRVKQMCCVANGREGVTFVGTSYDDLVKIGEESAPWFCSEHNVYVAFEFNPKSQGEPSDTSGSDRLKRVSIFHGLEGCM